MGRVTGLITLGFMGGLMAMGLLGRILGGSSEAAALALVGLVLVGSGQLLTRKLPTGQVPDDPAIKPPWPPPNTGL
jgi:hypothetical protein